MQGMQLSSHETLFEYAEHMGLQELHFKFDPTTGLRAVVAIHNTVLGPALGGCRCIEYDSEAAATRDAIRLAQGMTYKAALADLPFGGGKTTLMKPKTIVDRAAYFASFGEMVQNLGGRYLTAVDSGTTNDDMDLVAARTRYVFNPSRDEWSLENPSIHTAQGVFHGISACVKYQLGRENLQGLHIAIQGIGNVGMLLAELLHAAGAKLTVADKNQQAVAACQQRFQATAADPSTIHQTACDVFTPCALGGVLNDQIIKELNTPIVAGAANNQLGIPLNGYHLMQRGILYAPDYVINAGGLIYVASVYHNQTSHLSARLAHIAPTLLKIFERAKADGEPTSEVATTMAKEKIAASHHQPR